MSVAVDPLASIRAEQSVVTLGGSDYRLRAAMAAEWLPILLVEPMDTSAIIPGMVVAEDQDALEEALIEGRIRLEELEEACQEVVTLAAGRDWWWARNLLGAVVGVWMIVYGPLVAQGMDMARVPLGAVLDAMYATCAARMDKDRLREFDRELNVAPDGVVPVIDEDREAAQFLAMMNSGV